MELTQATRSQGSEHVLKSTLAGLASGLAATWVMTQFQNAMQRVKSNDSGGDEGEESPTVKVAEAISERVLHHELSERGKGIADPAVHYGFGTLVGGAYGALATVAPDLRWGGGAAYGAAVWLLADELSLPALGLSPPPAKVPASTHAYALGAHIVYGAALDVCYRAMTALLDAGDSNR